MRISLHLMIIAVFGVGASQARAVDFGEEVLPIFRRVCFECHGPKRQDADFRLDRREDVLDSWTLSVDAPADSELLRRISLPQGDAEVMPAIGKTLSEKEIQAIRQWIEQGATWPENLEVGKHWSYVAPVRPDPPSVQDPSWPHNAIDRFVLARLDAEGLRPSPQARPEKLLRRVFLDLIGLPPTPAEISAFCADPSDEAYERFVDDLLSRPQFGERWATPWLDLARYADSHGFQRDNLRDIWAYRDWVIRALNDDMPFDQFTIEQIAGDLLPDATESQRIATGFHRCTPTNVEAGSLPEETRIEQVIDRVNTTGAVWLGTTLECVQCHDHKFDPFTMKDYYRLLAFYNNTQAEAERSNPKVPSSIAFRGPSMSITDPVRDAKRSQLEQDLAALRSRQSDRRKTLSQDLAAWAHAMAGRLEDRPRTTAVEVTEFDSQGTTDAFEILDDGSILLVGNDPPATDLYTVRARVSLDGIRAFRLDALTHESLPGGGPGRGDTKRTNFVLNDFSVAIQPSEGSETKLNLGTAHADFSQDGWDVTGAIDDDAKSGWAIAPQFGRSHWATFILEEPLDATRETRLVFRLTHGFGNARSIGRLRLSAVTGNLDLETVPAEILAAAKKSADEWSGDERKELLGYRAEQDPEISALNRDIADLEKEITKLAPDTTLVMVELDEPRMTSVFQRGDYRNPGERVQPGVPAVLHPAESQSGDRLALARWLVAPSNPLVARVTVNRWWAELFGRGIVTTLEDFGIKGDPPSHPDLLDWLAVEFVEQGWSMKRVLRTIVTSSTYRQSSRATPELLQRDDANGLLARGPRFRMRAEMIRDTALAAAGLLSLKQFGPPIRPYQPPGIWSKVGGTNYEYVVSSGEDQFRRGVYVVLKRGSPYPSLINFDATSRLTCTVRRSRTNTPLQALTLLNDPAYVQAAKALAKRIVDEQPAATVTDRIAYGFLLCTSRHPTKAESQTLSELFTEQLQAAQADEAAAKQLVGDVDIPADVAAAELAAWYSVATTLLNLHETITKE